MRERRRAWIWGCSLRLRSPFPNRRRHNARRALLSRTARKYSLRHRVRLDALPTTPTLPHNERRTHVDRARRASQRRRSLTLGEFKERPRGKWASQLRLAQRPGPHEPQKRVEDDAEVRAQCRRRALDRVSIVCRADARSSTPGGVLAGELSMPVSRPVSRAVSSGRCLRSARSTSLVASPRTLFPQSFPLFPPFSNALRRFPLFSLLSFTDSRTRALLPALCSVLAFRPRD